MDDPEAFVGWARSARGPWTQLCKRGTHGDCYADLLTYDLVDGEPISERIVQPAGIHPVRSKVRDYPRRGKR